MNGKFYNSGRPSGFQYEKPMNQNRDNNYNDTDRTTKEMDDDLIIEENTIYEIDRACFERLKRQKKRKE